MTQRLQNAMLLANLVFDAYRRGDITPEQNDECRSLITSDDPYDQAYFHRLFGFVVGIIAGMFFAGIAGLVAVLLGIGQ